MLNLFKRKSNDNKDLKKLEKENNLEGVGRIITTMLYDISPSLSIFIEHRNEDTQKQLQTSEMQEWLKSMKVKATQKQEQILFEIQMLGIITASKKFGEQDTDSDDQLFLANELIKLGNDYLAEINKYKESKK
jgi:hypothetical protein